MSSWLQSRCQRRLRGAARFAHHPPHRDAGLSPRAVGSAFKATTGTGRPARLTPFANAMVSAPRLPGRRTRSAELLTFRVPARSCRPRSRHCCFDTSRLVLDSATGQKNLELRSAARRDEGALIAGVSCRLLHEALSSYRT